MQAGSHCLPYVQNCHILMAEQTYPCHAFNISTAIYLTLVSIQLSLARSHSLLVYSLTHALLTTHISTQRTVPLWYIHSVDKIYKNDLWNTSIISYSFKGTHQLSELMSGVFEHASSVGRRQNQHVMFYWCDFEIANHFC